MPTLADIYSAINTAKRKGADLIQNPGASLQQMVGYGVDRANAARDQLYDATASEGIGYGPKTKALAQNMAQAYNPIGMTTWHGSPHVFERFDLGKLGTGEGAQVYGKGLYLTESPETAERFRFPYKNYAVIKQNAPNQYDVLSKQGEKLAENVYFGKANKVKNEYDSTQTGNLYKVDLPDTHVRRMLDWDAPLKDQPRNVRALAKSLGMDMNDLGGDLVAKVGKDEAGREIMQKANIRGIKYLNDQIQQGKEQSRNFVVFDPNHLTILERNNQTIK